MVIENSHFTAWNSSMIWIHITFIDQYTNGILNQVTIDSSTFHGEYQILRADSNVHCNITMKNVNVSYGQHYDARTLEGTNQPGVDIHSTNLPSVITINSAKTRLALTDMIITAEVVLDTANITANNRTVSTAPFPYAHPPTTFLYNQVC